MLNLNDLYVFVQVVDWGGFAAAGRALNLPKSSLSKRVAELEQRLGVRLIQRSSRRFVVTEVGQEVYQHAAAMRIEAEAAENVVRGRLAEPSGVVRVTASVTTAQFSLADALPALALRYPKITVALHATDRYVDIVQEGFDIAVRDHSAPLSDSELVQRRVGFEPNFLVAAPAYLESHGVPQEPQALDGHDAVFVKPEARAPTWSLRHAEGASVVVQPAPRFFADEPVSLLKAATAGLGVTCLPRAVCRPGIEAGTLVRVLSGWQAGGYTTTLLVPHRRGQLPSVRATVDFLAEHIAAQRGDGAQETRADAG